MVSLRETLADDLLHDGEEAFERRRLDVGVIVAEGAVDLRERGRAERPLAFRAERHVDEGGLLLRACPLHVGREREPNVADGRERGDDERERRDLLFLLALRVAPHGVHRARVLAHGNGDAEFRAELQAHLLNRVVEDRVLAGVAARGHPVGGEADGGEVAHVHAGEVHDRLGDGEPPRRGPVEERDRGAFARRHRLTLERLVAERRHGRVGDGKLVGAHHLVAGDAPRHRAVGDGDEERLVGDGGQVENPRERVHRADALERDRAVRGLDALHLAHHARRLAEQDLDGHVDGVVLEMLVVEDELAVARRDADERDRAAFARAQPLEELAPLGTEREDVALLRLAAPNLHGAHRLLLVGDLPQLEAAARRLDEFGAAIGKPARADVVNGEDGVRRAERRARVDDALATALHLGVAALDGVEVEILRVRAGHHRGRRAAAQADAHGGAADLDDEGPRRDGLLLDLAFTDDAHAAREHDGLVVAAQRARLLGLQRAEEAAELRTAELVAEGRAADGPFRHDLKRRRQPRREVRVKTLPRLREVGNAQVGDHEAADARDRARAGARRRLVADLAAHARRRAGKRRDRRRVVVRLDLHEDVEVVLLEGVVRRLRVDGKDVRLEATDDGRVVLVGRERVLGTLLVRVLDHAEERVRHLLPADHKLRAENLVAAMLGVDLPEHRQLRVRRVALGGLETRGEVFELLIGNGKPHLLVRLADSLNAFFENIVGAPLTRLVRREEVVHRSVDTLGHLVVERGERRRGEGDGSGLVVWVVRDVRDVRDARPSRSNKEPDATLNAQNRGQPAVPENVRRLR